MKIGDVVKRRDFPFLYKIVGENRMWDCWVLESLIEEGVPEKLLRSCGLISKDDERWILVEQGRERGGSLKT